MNGACSPAGPASRRAGGAQAGHIDQLCRLLRCSRAGLLLGFCRLCSAARWALARSGLQLGDAFADLGHHGQGGFFAFQDGVGALAEIGQANVQHLAGG